MYLYRIRDLREYSGYKQYEIANYLGCHKKTYYKYEKGILDISYKRLIKLAQLHHVSCDYIVELRDDLGSFPGISNVPITLRLKSLRNRNKLSGVDVAKYLVCTQSNYSHYETGTRTIPLIYCIKLAKLYRVSMDYLLLGAGEQNPILQKMETSISD